MLDWYAAHARDLPWRVGPGARAQGVRPDPYRVWLSEVMLQQTTIAHATRYFLDFTGRWPDVAALAAAPDADVMAAWAGLGYYARARNLLKCARAVAAAGGEFPDTAGGLRALPGIGAYTAGAIAAIAFGRREAAVDGNVERVMARRLALEGEWAAQKAVIRARVADMVPAGRAGEFAEALMDLGATVCTPKRPDCTRCPWAGPCRARATGAPQTWPRKPAKAAPVARRGEVLVSLRGNAVRLERRPGQGLLGGMLGLPGTPWRLAQEDPPAPLPAPPPNPPEGAGAQARRVGEITHTFTHIRLTLGVWVAEVGGSGDDGLWIEAATALAALPTVFRKALHLALNSRSV